MKPALSRAMPLTEVLPSVARKVGEEARKSRPEGVGANTTKKATGEGGGAGSLHRVADHREIDGVGGSGEVRNAVGIHFQGQRNIVVAAAKIGEILELEVAVGGGIHDRSEEHTSELQS